MYFCDNPFANKYQQEQNITDNYQKILIDFADTELPSWKKKKKKTKSREGLRRS